MADIPRYVLECGFVAACGLGVGIDLLEEYAGRGGARRAQRRLLRDEAAGFVGRLYAWYDSLPAGYDKDTLRALHADFARLEPHVPSGERRTVSDIGAILRLQLELLVEADSPRGAGARPS